MAIKPQLAAGGHYEKEDAKNGILPLFPTTFNNQKKR
jgi:hypothetical protein